MLISCLKIQNNNNTLENYSVTFRGSTFALIFVALSVEVRLANLISWENVNISADDSALRKL